MVIGTPMRLRQDMVYRFGRGDTTGAMAVLTQVLIARQDEWPQLIPACAIASLVSGLPSLMLLPAFVKVLRTIA
jgi:hypothetical protein